MSFRGINTTVIQIRRQVFTEVARMAYANVKGEQANHLMRKIPYTIIPGEEGKLRKDIFLERAIVEERVRLAMGLPTRRMDEHNSVVSGLEDASIADKYYDCLLYTSQVHSAFFLPHTGQSPAQSALQSSTVGIWNINLSLIHI